MSSHNNTSSYGQVSGFRAHHPNTIYLANLNYDIKANEIEKLFSQYEDIKISDIKQRENKAFVFVTFGTREEAKAVIQKYSQAEFMGRKLIVDWSNKAGEAKMRPKGYGGFRERSQESKRHGRRTERVDKRRNSSDSPSPSRSKSRKEKKYSKSRSRSYEKPRRRDSHNYFNDPRALLKMIADGKSRHGSGVYEKIAGERLQSMINSKH